MTDLYFNILKAFKHFEVAILNDFFSDVKQVNGVDDFVGRKWIISAIDEGNYESVKFLIGRGAEVNFVDDEGYSPIHTMVGSKHGNKEAILKLLLSCGADINIRGLDSRTPLHLAVYEGDYEMASILVKKGADIHKNLNMWGETESSYEAAMRIGDIEMLELLKAHNKHL
jgi:ankyrin repeat protein